MPLILGFLFLVFMGIVLVLGACTGGVVGGSAAMAWDRFNNSNWFLCCNGFLLIVLLLFLVWAFRHLFD